MSIWPFVLGRFIELPYTLAQDFTLIDVMGERSPRLWLEKVAYIERWGGMAPDSTANNLSVFRFNPSNDRIANDATWKDGQGRVTWQATPANKIAVSYSQQTSCKCPSLMNAFVAPLRLTK